jgi:dihydroorotase
MTSLDIAGGRVFDPGQGVDASATVGIGDGLISGIEIGQRRTSARDDRDVIDASGLLVTPGLVDLHTRSPASPTMAWSPTRTASAGE